MPHATFLPLSIGMIWPSIKKGIDIMFFIRNNIDDKKKIRIDTRAEKELLKFPRETREKVKALIQLLAKKGELSEPDAKKIGKDLFEIRIRHQGQWRVFYAYLKEYP